MTVCLLPHTTLRPVLATVNSCHDDDDQGTKQKCCYTQNIAAYRCKAFATVPLPHRGTRSCHVAAIARPSTNNHALPQFSRERQRYDCLLCWHPTARWHSWACLIPHHLVLADPPSVGRSIIVSLNDLCWQLFCQSNVSLTGTWLANSVTDVSLTELRAVSPSLLQQVNTEWSREVGQLRRK